MSDVVFVVYEQMVVGVTYYRAEIIGAFEDYRKAKAACKGKSWRRIERVEVR